MLGNPLYHPTVTFCCKDHQIDDFGFVFFISLLLEKKLWFNHACLISKYINNNHGNTKIGYRNYLTMNLLQSIDEVWQVKKEQGGKGSSHSKKKISVNFHTFGPDPPP